MSSSHTSSRLVRKSQGRPSMLRHGVILEQETNQIFHTYCSHTQVETLIIDTGVEISTDVALNIKRLLPKHTNSSGPLLSLHIIYDDDGLGTIGLDILDRVLVNKHRIHSLLTGPQVINTLFGHQTRNHQLAWDNLERLKVHQFLDDTEDGTLMNVSFMSAPRLRSLSLAPVYNIPGPSVIVPYSQLTDLTLESPNATVSDYRRVLNYCATSGLTTCTLNFTAKIADEIHYFQSTPSRVPLPRLKSLNLVSDRDVTPFLAHLFLPSLDSLSVRSGSKPMYSNRAFTYIPSMLKSSRCNLKNLTIIGNSLSFKLIMHALEGTRTLENLVVVNDDDRTLADYFPGGHNGTPEFYIQLPHIRSVVIGSNDIEFPMTCLRMMHIGQSPIHDTKVEYKNDDIPGVEVVYLVHEKSSEIRVLTNDRNLTPSDVSKMLL